MQKFHFFNFILFCLNYKKLDVVIKKIFIRFNIFKKKIDKKSLINQLNRKKTSLKDYMKKENYRLYKEAEQYSESLKIKSSKKLKKIEYNLGGGGAYNLIYFLTRKIKPKIILETGVAAGYSSNAFLEAIHKNKIGKLFSSDFPYFRLENPEQYIGIVVPNDLKKNWRLEVLGDNKNFEKFRYEFDKINFLFYDSDKRYLSKKKFFKKIDRYIDKDTNIIIDDLHNDSFFFEYIEEKSINKWYILESKRKHIVGLILAD